MIQADNPWKDVCERKLPLVFELLLPQVAKTLDWSQDYEPLDQELRRFSPTSRTSGRIADRLLKVMGASGDPRFIHLEVQGKKVRGFRRRIHVCNLRAEERFNVHVMSLAILTDGNRQWRPRRYVSGTIPLEDQPGSSDEPVKKARKRYLDERTLTWPLVKLIDYVGREEELKALENPMGLFVVAHLEAMRTRSDLGGREQAKFRLLCNLRLRRMDAEDARLWATCIDWFLQLPPDRELAIRQELDRLDKEQNVPYLSFLERYALEQGLEKGLEQGLEKGLEQGLEKGLEQGLEKGRLEMLGWYLTTKYGPEARSWLTAAEKISDESQLKSLCESVFQADSVEKVRELLVRAGDSPGIQ